MYDIPSELMIYSKLGNIMTENSKYNPKTILKFLSPHFVWLTRKPPFNEII